MDCRKAEDMVKMGKKNQSLCCQQLLEELGCWRSASEGSRGVITSLRNKIPELCFTSFLVSVHIPT